MANKTKCNYTYNYSTSRHRNTLNMWYGRKLILIHEIGVSRKGSPRKNTHGGRLDLLK